MIQTISLTTALIGTTAAAIWDLKTTEVPDHIPYAMIAIALLLFSYQSFVDWSYMPILNSLIPGLMFLGFGFIMYYLGQWGGADALLLSSIGFLLPGFPNFSQTIFPYALTFFINLFLVGAAYMLLYAVVFAILNKKIFSKFSNDLRASSRLLLFGSIGLFIIFFLANFYIAKTFLYEADYSMMLVNSFPPLILTMALFLVWRFAKAVEEYGFKKKIPVSKLKIGDMLLEERKLIGVTEKQLKKIKKSGKRYVWIKEGVRFAPSFVLALIFTLIYGDGILFFIKFLA